MPTFNQLIGMGYLKTQHDRILATARKIDARNPLNIGRVIPNADDLAMHEGRCLQATVLFLDISGFTQRPQETQAQQEVMLRGLSLFFTEMIRVVEDFGGTVEKNTGDGLMAYFVREPDEGATMEQRSVAAAITMFQVADLVIDNMLLERGVDPFKFRICIDRGALTIAKMGAAQRFNGIVAIGTPANLACKMLHVAKAGELMIGNNVALGLPNEWQQYIHRSDHVTGYHYVTSGEDYGYWYYTGRWVR